MAEFRRIGIISRPSRKTTAESIRRVARLVKKKDCELLVDEETARVLETSEGLELPELAEQADLGVVVGGDGTLLRAVRHLAPRNVPVCGVNRGRLGFLADIYPEQIPSVLGAILDGEYEIDQRSILVGEVLRGDEQLCVSDALNDVVIHSYRDLHMIELQTLISGRPLSSLRAGRADHFHADRLHCLRHVRRRPDSAPVTASAGDGADLSTHAEQPSDRGRSGQRDRTGSDRSPGKPRGSIV